MKNKDFALLAARVLDQKKAQDIVVIDIQEKSSFADYLVIASGGSERQVLTLTDEVEEQMDREGLIARSIEGKNHSGWVLMDFGDIIVNIFTKETREKYNIEKVWGDCSFWTGRKSSKMNERYDFKTIEKKWQNYWKENQCFKTTEDKTKEKYYVLEMFPYPRANCIWVMCGTIPSVTSSPDAKKMQGFNVQHPMGFDSFGLPAENAAIKHGIEPSKWTWDNIHEMEMQLNQLGLSYDWDREVQTCSPITTSGCSGSLFSFIIRVWLTKRKTGKLVPELSDGAGQRTGRRRLL